MLPVRDFWGVFGKKATLNRGNRPRALAGGFVVGYVGEEYTHDQSSGAGD